MLPGENLLSGTFWDASENRPIYLSVTCSRPGAEVRYAALGDVLVAQFFLPPAPSRRHPSDYLRGGFLSNVLKRHGCGPAVRRMESLSAKAARDFVAARATQVIKV